MANPWPPVHLLTCPYSLALPLNHVTGGFGLTCVAPEGKEEKELRGPGGNRRLPTRGAGAFLQLWGWIKVDSHPGPLPSPAACCSPHLRTPSCGSGQVVCRDLALQEQSALPWCCLMLVPCSGLDVRTQTGGTFPTPSPLHPQHQATPVALLGRVGIWCGRPAGGSSRGPTCACQPATSALALPASGWARRAGGASWSCPAAPGRLGKN